MKFATAIEENTQFFFFPLRENIFLFGKDYCYSYIRKRIDFDHIFFCDSSHVRSMWRIKITRIWGSSYCKIILSFQRGGSVKIHKHCLANVAFFFSFFLYFVNMRGYWRVVLLQCTAGFWDVFCMVTSHNLVMYYKKFLGRQKELKQAEFEPRISVC